MRHFRKKNCFTYALIIIGILLLGLVVFFVMRAKITPRNLTGQLQECTLNCTHNDETLGCTSQDCKKILLASTFKGIDNRWEVSPTPLVCGADTVGKHWRTDGPYGCHICTCTDAPSGGTHHYSDDCSAGNCINRGQCTVPSDCFDGDTATQDVCLNPGTSQSTCQHYNETCNTWQTAVTFDVLRAQYSNAGDIAMSWGGITYDTAMQRWVMVPFSQWPAQGTYVSPDSIIPYDIRTMRLYVCFSGVDPHTAVIGNLKECIVDSGTIESDHLYDGTISKWRHYSPGSGQSPGTFTFTSGNYTALDAAGTLTIPGVETVGTLSYNHNTPAAAERMPFSWHVTSVPHACSSSSASPYLGHLDPANCDAISGWVCNKAQRNVQIGVELYDGPKEEGGTLLTTVIANGSNSPANGECAGGVTHSFSTPIPQALRNSQAHRIFAYFATMELPAIAASPITLTCSAQASSSSSSSPPPSSSSSSHSSSVSSISFVAPSSSSSAPACPNSSDVPGSPRPAVQTEVGLFAPAERNFFLNNYGSLLYPNVAAGLVPFSIDPTNSGYASLGLYDPQTFSFYVRDEATQQWRTYPNLNHPAYFGSNTLPVAGDWRGKNFQTFGIYDPATSHFYLYKHTLANLAANSPCQADGMDIDYGKANGGWLPVAGDWDNNGTDSLGLFDTSSAHFHLRYSNTTGNSDMNFGFGTPGRNQRPIVGDWNGDGAVSLGVYDPDASHFFLRNPLSEGDSTSDLGYGSPGGGWLPVTGRWGASPVSF